jgi:hypothetical protein
VVEQQEKAARVANQQVGPAAGVLKTPAVQEVRQEILVQPESNIKAAILM